MIFQNLNKLKIVPIVSIVLKKNASNPLEVHRQAERKVVAEHPIAMMVIALTRVVEA